MGSISKIHYKDGISALIAEKGLHNYEIPELGIKFNVSILNEGDSKIPLQETNFNMNSRRKGSYQSHNGPSSVMFLKNN